MAMMFGRFEILGELSKSGLGVVYKATDTETNQAVALKTVRLDALGERTATFVERLIAEGETTRDLSSQNIALLYGAGEIENQFCAAMEYVQGNSVANMLLRREGFSIWDLLDITRQVCAGLDQAASMGVVHHSLEPAKVMVQWDGLVKILGYGISSMSLISLESGQGLGDLMAYCSPEMLRGDAIDVRSNLFTWGAILYEMVTDRRAFDAADPENLEHQVVNKMPPAPLDLNSKIHPGVSALIMKALAKDPGARFQTARDLATELELCKEGGAKPSAAPAPKKPAAAGNPAVSAAARAAAASKFVSASPKAGPASSDFDEAAPQPSEAKARAAAVGLGQGSAAPASGTRIGNEAPQATFEVAPQVTNSNDDGGALIAGAEFESSPNLSATAAAPKKSSYSPKIAVDPLTAGPTAGSTGKSFSELDELPPLKEPVYVEPPAPEPLPEVQDQPSLRKLHIREEKPKVQPREVAEKAIQEIKTVPPQLMLFSILGAVAVILVIAVALYFHVRSEDDDSTASPRPTAQATPHQAPQPQAAPPATQITEIAPEPIVEQAQPEVVVRNVEKHAKKKSAPQPAAAAAVAPGQVQIDSNPQGAQIQIDGRSDPSWITPFDVTGLAPGQHTVSVTKPGYAPDMRSVEIASGGKSFVSLHLSPINALLVVNSTPTGAEVLLDGKPTGKVTPVQFAVEKGNHTVLLRKPGYLEETTTADLSAGQNFQFSPALRALGNVDEIRTVGKFKKLFGGSGGDSTVGMGTVSIHTQPKGAQVAINRRLLDKMSPVDVMLGPGNYIVDITLTGFKPIHKVISVDKGGKVAIDETLERE
jgi:serine/threonine-protein kinase